MFTYMGRCYRAFEGFYSLDTSDKALMQFVDRHPLIERVKKFKVKEPVQPVQPVQPDKNPKVEIKSEK